MSAYRRQLPLDFYARGGDQQWGLVTTDTRWELRLLGFGLTILFLPILFVLFPVLLVLNDPPSSVR